MGAPPMRRESHLRAPFRSRMASEVFFAHMNARNVRVYLRRSDVGMTEDFLDVIINNGDIGPVSHLVYDTITGIQSGKVKDEFGWVTKVD